MKKRILSMLLAIVMVVGLVPGFTVTASAAEITPSQPAGGDGSEGNPYQITTAAELYWFAEYVNAGNASACAKLMNDITVNENVIVNGALNSDTSGFVAWTPIGVRAKAFSGTFDGNNKTISGLYVSATSGYQGLIGFMESGTVKNVTVAYSYFSGTTNIGAVVGCYGQTGTASIVTNCHNIGSIVIGSDYYVGGVVGGQYAPATSHAQIVVSDCSNSGSVTGAKHYVGGIIGYAEYFSEGTAISNCTNTGSITCTSTNRAQGTGGIVGYFGGSSAAKVEIVGCTNSGKVSIVDGGKQDYMGGIVGRNNYGHISDCDNTGTISGYQYAGGIVGSNSGTVTNCQNTGDVISTYAGIGGIVGNNNGTVTGCTNGADVQGQWYVGGIIGTGIGTGLSGCTNTGDVTSNTYGAGGVIGYVDAAGTVENCHNEGKVKGTYYIGGLVGYHYSGKVNYTECSNKGNVEGSSYDIGGLFGRITDSTVTECYNTGNVTCTGTYSTSWDYGVGGLAGATYNAAIFENCYNTGAVNGGSNANIGGLVGFFTYASGSTNHYIKNSHNTGSVTGGKNTGGLFGSYEAKGVSENCYNTGAVTGGQNTGGLVGYHQSTGGGIGVIKNCYNTGAVSGTSYVGGLFGYEYYNNCLETSYNVGTVSGTTAVGGVNGRNTTSVVDCYYLDTCVTSGNTVTGATALTAEQMTDDANWQTNYAGFDTTTPVWSKQNNEGTKKYLPKLDSYSPTLHVHNWAYSAIGNTITATCNVNGCPDTNGGTVTISAPTDLIYSNSSKDAACSYSNWLPDKEGTIVYNTVDRINVTGEVITASITIDEATASVSYQITPREITTSMVTLSPSSATYDGSEKTVAVTVKYSSTTLTDGTDYEFTGTTSATEISTGSGYAVTVTGKGNYTGEATKYWKIKKLSLSSEIEIEGWTYLDTPIEPSVTNNPENGEVTYTYYISIGRRPVMTGPNNGAQSEGGVPTYAGTYYVGADIAETDHYNSATIFPSVNTEFVISPREVSNPTFEGLQATYPCDSGNEIKPTFTLKDDLGNVIPASEYTVSYNNNIDAGEATITIIDVEGGNYTVSGSATFEIVTHSHEWKYELDGTDTIKAICIASGCTDTDGGSVTITVPANLDYTGNAIEAVVDNELTTGDNVTVVYTGNNLVAGNPVKIGTYTATITLGEGENKAEINVTYTITHASHNLEYSNITDTQHTASCACGYSKTENHDFKHDTVNHKCICEKVEQFTITYTDGVDGETVFADMVLTADYGAATPSFGGEPTRAGYSFANWSPALAATVSGNQTYTATWTEKAAVNITETPQTYNWDGTAKSFNVVGTALTGFTVEYFVNGEWTGTAPSDAGKYNVKITRAEDDTYKAYSKEISNGLVINPADVSVEVTGIDGWTYREDADTPTVVVKFNGNEITSGYGAVTYTYYTDDACTVRTSAQNGAAADGGVPAYAGTYYVKASVAAAGNYKAAVSDAVSFTIAQKSISGVTVSEIADQTYTGEALNPNFTVKDDETTLTKDVDYTVVYENNINTGKAVVTITGIGNYKESKEATFDIVKADWTTKTASDAAMYNTKNNSLDLTNYIAPGGTIGTPSVGTENVLANVSVTNGTLNYDVLAGVTAETVTVSVPVTGATNHKDYEITVTINLSVKPSQTITVEDVTEDKLTFTYGDTDAAISADSNIDAAISYAVTEGDYISVDASTGKITINKVGTAVITVTAAETDAYAKTTKTVTVEIKAKQIAAPSSDSTAFVYNGSEQIYGISATGDYSVSGNKQTNAGNYTVIVELADKVNTVWADSKDTANKEYAFHIAKAKLTVTADDKEAYIGSRMPELTYTVDGLADGDSISVELSCDANMNRIGETPIVVTATDASGNYEITAVNGTLNVKMIYIPIIPSDPTYPPVVDEGDNGDVSVSPKNPEKGDTVTIIPDPDAGYEVDEVIVTDKNGNPVTVVDNGDGTYSFKQLSGKVNIEVTFKEITKVCPRDWTCPMYGYTDLDMTAWYHDGIHYCIEHGLMQGIGNNQFNPNGTTTRAMIVTILWRLEGSPVVNYAMDFEDVEADQWYTEAIRWAASEKIVEGYGNGKFGTNDAITREQFVTIMFRYAKYKGYDVSVGENTNILSYDDAFDVAEWAIPAMQWACGSGMIQGIADGNQMNLAPQGNATRAQAAAILQRFCENVADKE